MSRFSYQGSLDSWLSLEFNYSEQNPLCYVSELYLDGERLDSLVVPESVNSINKYAFYGCKSLEYVKIPNHVNTIGYYAFAGCTSLQNIYVYHTTPLSISYSVFSSEAISSATLHVPKGSKNIYKISNVWSDFANIVDDVQLEYNLICMLDGEVYQTIAKNVGDELRNIPRPAEREGYIFSGWQGLPERMPEHDVTVTGSFTPTTGISALQADEAEQRIYSPDGRRVSQPHRGLNIIRTADGRTVKAMRR